MVDSALKYLPLLLFLGWLYWRGRLSRIGLPDALAYWLREGFADALESDTRVACERVVRYLRETYGSGLPLQWLNRALLSIGLIGSLLSGVVILVNGWYGVRGVASPGWLLNGCIFPVAAGVLLPILALQWGSWRHPLKQRRMESMIRIFGSEAGAIEFSRAIRGISRKSGEVSLWAFPMGSDGWLTRLGNTAPWTVVGVLLALYFQQSVNFPEFLVGAISVIALLFLPVNITGFCMAFGKWKVAHDMTYPLAIFFDDMDHLT